MGLLQDHRSAIKTAQHPSIEERSRRVSGACSSTVFPRGCSILQVSAAPMQGPSGVTGGYLFYSGYPWAARGQPDSPCSALQAEGKSPVPGDFLPPPAQTFRSAELFLSHSLIPIFGCSFCPFFNPPFFFFLNMLSQRCCHHCYGLSLCQKWSTFGSGCHLLFLTWGKLLTASHRSQHL